MSAITGNKGFLISRLPLASCVVQTVGDISQLAAIDSAVLVVFHGQLPSDDVWPGFAAVLLRGLGRCRMELMTRTLFVRTALYTKSPAVQNTVYCPVLDFPTNLLSSVAGTNCKGTWHHTVVLHVIACPSHCLTWHLQVQLMSEPQ